MALNTPIALSIPAFDATESQLFSFTVSGGDQVVGNTLTIIDNVSGDIVYTNTVTSYVYSQLLPANTLTNGDYYAFYFNTINLNGDVSANSNMISFRCYTTPTLRFTNIPALGIIESANYRFLCEYEQLENEEIDYLYFYLYDRNKNRLQISNIYTYEDREPLLPNIVFAHTFSSLEDDQRYYIRAMGATVEGTNVDTDYVPFTVDYQYDETYLMVSATNYPNNGYVLLENNTTAIDGKIYDIDGHEIQPTIIDDMLYLEDGNELVWDNGFQFKNTKFTKVKWWKAVWTGETLVASNESGDTYFTVELMRRLPIGGSYAKDYIIARFYENGVKYAQKMSALKTPINNNSNIITLISVDGNDITVEFEDTTVGDHHNYFDIDTGESNVEFGRITDIFFEDEAQAPVLEDTDIVGSPTEYTELTKVTLKNSIVDDIYMSKNNFTVIPDPIPDWGNDTILKATFENGSISAGNVDWILSNIDNVKIKRRIKGEFDYVTIYKHEIHEASDLLFEYKDYWIPSGLDVEYNFVTCVGDNEGSYYTAEVTTCFNGLFVSDGEKTMKLYSNYLISSANTTQLTGMVQPYGLRYPVIIRNPNVNYRTVTIQGDILGLEDDEGAFNYNVDQRYKIVKQKAEWDAFLTNGKMKTVKDWNGNIILGGITTAPSYSYNQVNTNGIPTMTFTITEQGQYNNQKDLYNLGFTNVPA